MPMYADLLESSKEAALDFVFPYEEPKDELNETEELADALYGDGEKAPSALKKVYLLEDHAPLLEEKLGKKRKRQLDTVEEADEHVDPDDDKQRPHALLLHGEPISKLGTEKIFEYVATYCDEPPTSLEWVDDRTTVIIFESQATADASLSALVKDPTETAESLVPAHPVPQKLWPPEAQLDHNLSQGTALSGVMRIRWARFGDRKLRDARKRSEWYQMREGQGRGKRSRRREGEDMDLDAELDEMKRRREAGDEPEEWDKERASALDAELDDMTRRKESGEDTSTLGQRLGPKKDREIAPLPRRRGARGDGGRRDERRGDRSSHERPKRTQDDLDAELEAFMKARE